MSIPHSSWQRGPISPHGDMADDFSPSYGVAERVAPGIRRVLAHNPSAFSYYGTGTYIVGEGTVAVIDPGPNDPDHLAALQSALGAESVSNILITHTHYDHSPDRTSVV